MNDATQAARDRTLRVIYLARYEDRHGVFEAAATTETNARVLLRAAYEDHERRHGRAPHWAVADVEVRAIESGSAWIDRERIAALFPVEREDGTDGA